MYSVCVHLSSCLHAFAVSHFLCICPLQIIDSPKAKDNRGKDSTKAKDQNGSITSIQCGTDTVANLFGITTTRSRTLRATKAWTLFLKVESSTFRLEYSIKMLCVRECVQSAILSGGENNTNVPGYKCNHSPYRPIHPASTFQLWPFLLPLWQRTFCCQTPF